MLKPVYHNYVGVLIFAVVLILIPIQGRAERAVVVGVVTDGPSEQWVSIRSAFIEELTALTENEFKIQAPDSKQLDGEWMATKVAAALDRLDIDAQTDVVIALGFAASQQAASRKSFNKPTFAPFVTNTSLSSIPQKDLTSGVKN